MPLYRYSAKDAHGMNHSGSLEAPDEAFVIRNLQSRGIYPIKIQRVANAQKNLRKAGHRRVKSEDLVAFCNELSVLLNAGVKIVRALSLITEQIQSQILADTVVAMVKDIEGGATFSQAIAKYPRVFPEIWIHIVEAGEASGHLSEVLKELSRYLEMRENLTKKIVSSMMYPAVLVTVAIGAIAFFMLRVIPIFANLFKSFKAELPLPTRLVILLSNFLTKYFVFIILGLVLAIYLFRRFLKTPAGQRMFDAFILKAPVIDQFTRDIILARISINMAVLIKSGVDFLKSLDIVSHLAGNSFYRDALNQAMLDVREGQLASEALGKNPLFSSQMVQMIQIGEESGKLDEMLQKLGEYYENRVNVFIGRINVLIEPVILLFVGTAIGFLVISMFMPIFSLSNVVR